MEKKSVRPQPGATENEGSGGITYLAVLGVLWGLFVTIFWMCVGWRAMRAHEDIARGVHDIRGSIGDIAKVTKRTADS